MRIFSLLGMFEVKAMRWDFFVDLIFYFFTLLRIEHIPGCFLKR